ncbi:hypothetical protein N431DRAFT_64912 [Stipitochalara longipes BDJ]|nr:hypothetical protein N431DRAFT_64912 [Stipitochalara longipes BDJ]
MRVAVQEKDDSPKPPTRKFLGSPLISNEMVQILRSIRILSLTQISSKNTASGPASHNEDFQAACFGIQQQLKDLKSTATTATLENACILSAHMYIDKILLDLPFEKVFRSGANPQLQDVIMKSRRTAEELEDNKEILDWIVTVNGMNVFLDESEVASKFHIMVTRLEVLHT